jgi:hypothetical protein
MFKRTLVLDLINILLRMHHREVWLRKRVLFRTTAATITQQVRQYSIGTKWRHRAPILVSRWKRNVPTSPYIQNYWVSGLCTSSRILTIRKHNVLETVSVSALRWGEGDTTRLGPLERPNLNLWIQFPKRCVLLIFRVPDDGQSPEIH